MGYSTSCYALWDHKLEENYPVCSSPPKSDGGKHEYPDEISEFDTLSKIQIPKPFQNILRLVDLK